VTLHVNLLICIVLNLDPVSSSIVKFSSLLKGMHHCSAVHRLVPWIPLLLGVAGDATISVWLDLLHDSPELLFYKSEPDWQTCLMRACTHVKCGSVLSRPFMCPHPLSCLGLQQRCDGPASVLSFTTFASTSSHCRSVEPNHRCRQSRVCSVACKHLQHLVLL
jgi:hypothetical protein